MSKENTLSHTNQHLETFHTPPQPAIFQIDLRSNLVDWNNNLKHIHEVPLDYIPTMENCYGNYRNDVSEQKILQAHKNAIEHSTPFQLMYEIITATGNSRHLEVTVQPFMVNGQCTSLYGVVKEISQNRNQNPEILQLKHQLNNAEKLAKSGSWNWNIITGELKWSANFYEIFDHKKSNPISYDVYLGYIHEDDREAIARKFDLALKTKIFPECSYKIQLKNGTIKTVFTIGKVISNENGEVITMLGTCQDITDRIVKEQELQQTNQQLKLTNNINKIGSWQLDISIDEFKWTDNLYRIFEIALGTKISFKVLQKYTHPDDLDFLKVKFNEIITKNRSQSFSHRIKLENGTIKTVQVVSDTITDAKGQVIYLIGTTQDISKKINKELELIQTHQQLSLTEKTSKAGTWSWNPITGMFKWSENLYEIMDFDKNIPMNFEILYTRIHPEDKHIVDDSMQFVQDTNSKCTFIHRIIINDGSIKTLEIVADIISNTLNTEKELIGTARDITNTLNIEQELIEKNQLLNFAEHLTSMGYWRYKPATNSVFWSENLYHMFDQPKTDKLTFDSYFDKIHPEDKELVKEKVSLSIKDNKFYDFTHRIVLKNNQTKVIQIIGKVTVNKSDGLQELLGTCLDITESHTKDLEISKKNYRLNIAEGMAKIGYWQWSTPTNEVFWSDNLHEIYGHPKEAPLTFETYINYIHKEDREHIVTKLTNAMQSGSFPKSTYRIQLADGTIKIIKSIGKIIRNNKGEVIEMTGVCQDITETKIKELELLQRNQQLNMAEQMAMLGSWEWKPEKNIYKWSDNLYRIYGFKLGSAVTIERALASVYPPDLDRVKKIIKEIFKGIDHKHDIYRIILNNGEIKTLEVRRETSKDKDGNIEIIGSTQDITDQVKAKKQIQEKNHILSIAEEIATMGSWKWNPATGESTWSDNLYKIYGIALHSTITTELFLSKVHLDDIEKVNQFIKEILNTNNSDKTLTFRIIKSHGIIRSLELLAEITKDQNGNIIEIVGTTQDVTDRIKREQDLLEKNQLLNFAEQLSSIGHWKWDIINDNLEKSENLLKILDFNEETRPDFDTYLKRVHPADRDKVIELGQRIIDTKQFNKFHHRIVKDDKSIRTIKIIGEVILDKEGNVIELIGSSQDITEQIEAQQKILDTNRSLEKSTMTLTSKNEQLAEFNHITSHNLRSPVSNLNALLHIYKKTDNEHAKIEIFEKFEIVIDHLTETLNALIETITLKHNTAVIKEELSFDKTLLKTKEILAAELIETKARITSNFTKAKNVKYNPIYLESIFLNLVSNSLKYKSPDRVPEIFISSKMINGTTHLEFKDNGLGINMKMHGQKIFGLNKVFHKHPEARGIGLFLTKAQITSMGGTISVASEVNIGTTFYITLN
ncbi:PAS domain-containing protein [Maribacter ulvicola]|uniref:histidine kinase n=1 Tax=Maribacter ulvicola TaxID=228959 RepID=A0A1N6RB89_9FLAO|nr:PAS domain-containing protein [Maribacter ulvicola]SIQ25932.1 PAS domain S-box-containing protein [Maribacter ulvicola]